MATTKFYGTGRRKKSIARVYLVPGTGKITINKRDIDEYFGLETLKVVVRQPLVATETADKFDVLVNVHGGGFTGQAGAIRHGISRALLEADAEYRPVLKSAGYLTRDPRMKERKKYGLKAARRAPRSHCIHDATPRHGPILWPMWHIRQEAPDISISIWCCVVCSSGSMAITG